MVGFIKWLVRRVGLVLTAAVMLAGTGSVGSVAAAPAGWVASASPEQVWLVNATRYGSRGFIWHIQCLNSLAEDWAKYMSDHDMFEHNPFLVQGIEQRCGGSWSAAGENIALGQGSNQLFGALMKSEGHRRNIMSEKFTRMGAAAYRNERGDMNVVQVFADCSNCGGGWNELARPQGDIPSVKGGVDVADCRSIRGWSLDLANPFSDNRVDIYVDGKGISSATTNGTRGDINQGYATTGRHGFTVPVPQTFRDGKPHKVEAYGITTNAAANALLATRTIGPCR